jgi:hypothetical protein
MAGAFTSVLANRAKTEWRLDISRACRASVPDAKQSESAFDTNALQFSI